MEENKFGFLISSLLELGLKITCTFHQAKLAIFCQTPLVVPIPLKNCMWRFCNALNQNLQSDLLSDHFRHTSFRPRCWANVSTSELTYSWYLLEDRNPSAGLSSWRNFKRRLMIWEKQRNVTLPAASTSKCYQSYHGSLTMNWYSMLAFFP